MTLGKKIETLRRQNHMTMEELGALLGVGRSAVNKYEKGIVVNLKRSTIVSLCRIFNVPSSFFLEDDPDYNEDEQRLILLYRGAEDTAKTYALQILENNQKKDTSSKAE